MRVSRIKLSIQARFLTFQRHATLACYKALQSTNPSVSIHARFCQVVPEFGVLQLLRHWERTGYDRGQSDTLELDLTTIYSQAKIALKANSEDELLELEAVAKSLNLAARSILDAWVSSLKGPKWSLMSV